MMVKKSGIVISTMLVSVFCVCAQDKAEMNPAGGFKVEVSCNGITAVLSVDAPDVTTVKDEKYDSLAMFAGPFWRCGTPLRGPKAEACSVCDALDTKSLVVRAGPGVDAKTYTIEKDYKLEPHWAGFGRIEGSSIPADQPVFASYRYVLKRIDSVVLSKDKKLLLRKGEPHVATPALPGIKEGEIRVGNIWISGWMKAIGPDNLFPVLETAYPEQSLDGASIAERLLPKHWINCAKDSRLKILALGDSVTECVYLPQEKKWQEQFVVRLRKRFPNAKIEMLSQGWEDAPQPLFAMNLPGARVTMQRRCWRLNRT